MFRYDHNIDRQSEIDKIKTNKTGGLDQRYVQLALRGMFRDKPDVYVPTAENLTECFPMLALQQHGKKYIAFSLASDQSNQHQIAAFVVLGAPHQVTLIDSRQQPFKKEVKNQLKRLMGDDIEIEEGVSPYSPQNDDWSCGIHVIANCQYMYLRQDLNHIDKKRKRDFNPSVLLEDIFDLIQQESEYDRIQSEALLKNLEKKQNLLSALTVLSQEEEKSTYSGHRDFSSIMDFLQAELSSTQEEYYRLRPCADAVSDYGNRQDSLGEMLLVLADCEASLLQENIIFAIKSVSEPFPDLAYKALREGVNLLKTELSFALNKHKEDQEIFLKKMLNVWMEMSSEKKYLEYLLDELDVDFSLDYFPDGTAIWLIKEMVDRLIIPVDGHQNTSQPVLSEQQAIYGTEGEERRNFIKSLLPDLENEPLMVSRLAQPAAFMFIKKFGDFINKYVFTSSEKNKIYLTVASHVFYPDIAGALHAFPESLHPLLLSVFSKELDNMDGEKLVRILAGLPMRERLGFATQYVQKGAGGDTLASVLAMLDERDRLEFAVLHEQKIQDGYDLARVLHTLNVSDRSTFARKHENKIQYSYELRAVLLELPEEETVEFVNNHVNIIRNENGESLANVLSGLPQKFRLSFAEQFKSRIRSNYELSCVLKILPEDSRMRFFDENSHNFNLSSASVSLILPVLPEPERLAFFEKHKKKLNRWDVAQAILACPESSRLSLAEDCSGLIRYGDGAVILARFLSAVPQKERLLFAGNYTDEIKSGDGLALVLYQLEMRDRLFFATENEKYIRNGVQLEKVLRNLHPKDRPGFLEKHKHKIYSGQDLSSLVKMLPAGEKLAFANQYADRIWKFDEFLDVMKLLPKSDRLAFFNDHPQARFLRFSDDFCKILHELPLKDRTTVAWSVYPSLPNNAGMSGILAELPDDDRVAFAMAHAEFMWNGGDLSNVLECLPESERFDFSMCFAKKIGSARELAYVLEALPSSDRLSFAKIQVNKPINDWEKSRICACLSTPEDQKAFQSHLLTLSQPEEKKEHIALMRSGIFPETKTQDQSGDPCPPETLRL